MLSIAFSWPAWTGVNTSWLIIWDFLTKNGYKVYADKEYQSIIKWWNNSMIIYFDKQDIFLSKKIDLFIYFDDFALERNNKIYDFKYKIKIPNERWLFQNMIAVWVGFKAIWVDESDAIKQLKEYFSYKKLPEEVIEKNISSIKFWYTIDVPKLTNVELSSSKSKLLDGNKVIANWALKAWLEFYSAYPMTPASSLIKHLADKVTFFQWEDEIAVSMSMLGARFAWKRAMCWTSWWWFALMTESISFANQAEIWWVYILSQRWWPSTWTPTFTEQGDLLFALNASFWDTKPIVVYPYDFENWYKLIQKVLDWSDIYQHPIIVLLDKQFSESYYSVNLDTDEITKNKNLDKVKYNPNNKEEFLALNELENNKFLRYKLTDNWISPYTYPGIKNWEFIASSYEHTESGFSTEDPQIKKIMTEKRHKKLKTFIKNEFNDNFFWFDIINPDAEKFIITTWINHLVCKHFAKKHNWGLITINVLQPLDTRFKKYLTEKIKKIVFVELNYSWQLQHIVSSQIWLNCPEREWKISYIRKYNNYPLFIEDLEENLL